jgi:hypothetical protein
MSTRSSFWGLVEQKGPWKMTLNDVERTKRYKPNKQAGGGIPIGGTKKAGHASWYASIKPKVDATVTPAPPDPGHYVQNSIIMKAPMMSKSAKGSIIRSTPVESLRPTSSSVQKPGHHYVPHFQLSEVEAPRVYETPSLMQESSDSSEYFPADDDLSTQEIASGNQFQSTTSNLYPEIDTLSSTSNLYSDIEPSIYNPADHSPIENQINSTDQNTQTKPSTTDQNTQTNPNTKDQDIQTTISWEDLVEKFKDFYEMWESTSELLNSEKITSSHQAKELHQLATMLTQMFDETFPGKDWRSLIDPNQPTSEGLLILLNSLRNDPQLLISMSKRMFNLTEKIKQVKDQATSPKSRKPTPISTKFRQKASPISSSSSEHHTSGSSYVPSTEGSPRYMDSDAYVVNVKSRQRAATKKFQRK